MLERHYAPGTPLKLVDSLEQARDIASDKRLGVLSFCDTPPAPDAFAGIAAVEMLSTTGSLREAAANLFAAMRRLDAADLDLILAQRVPDRGLGMAINDRLRRAAAT